MKEKKRIYGRMWTATLTLAVVILMSALPVRATVTWDDLVNGSYEKTPLGYGNHNWYFGDADFGAIGSHERLEYSTVDWAFSGQNAAYNAWGDTPMRIESLTTAPGDAFTFSAWFSSHEYPGFGSGADQIQVQGFIGGSATPEFTTVFSLPVDASENAYWVQKSFTGSAVNKLLFSPLDSDGNPSAFLEGYFWMDNAEFSAVPEPTTLVAGALLLLPFGLQWFRCLRNRKAS
ncbi:MAG: hypothetical protein AB9869_05435 [Verrucomicrobiia bacterium]